MSRKGGKQRTNAPQARRRYLRICGLDRRGYDRELVAAEESCLVEHCITPQHAALEAEQGTRFDVDCGAALA